ncbi:MAG TPA: DnaJ domain-containing protein [Verrucomicrobiae bacterium]|jgi:curved DNA-binding protein CbpA|nr:DnaJ domain-containing protein [Verrucomicrobiae bacterium]
MDYFALLKEARRPWLDPEELKRKFLALSSELHPDRNHNAEASEKLVAQQRYTDINAAYNCLREPGPRLAHLLELERGARAGAVQQVPPELMETFMKVSGVIRDADALIASRQSASSPLLRARIFSGAQGVLDALASQSARIADWRQRLINQLKDLDAEWVAKQNEPNAREGLLERMESMRHTLNYLGRWSSQLTERSFQLTS